MIQSALDFLTQTNPPQYGHQLNLVESTSHIFLFPFSMAVDSFEIKYPVGESPRLTRIAMVALAILTSPLTLIGAFLKGIGRILPHSFKEATDAQILATDSLKIQQCYDLAATLKRICLKQGFVQKIDHQMPRFQMCSGTALGAVRHGGIIPWDDDCDFVVFGEDEPEFLRLFEVFQREGIEIQNLRFDSTYKLRFSDEWVRKTYGVKALEAERGEIDVFIWSKMSDGSYTYDKAATRARWKNEYFTPQDLEQGLQRVPFGPKGKEIELPLLKTPHVYLARYYGENFLDQGIQTHGHLVVTLGFAKISIPFFKLGAHYFKIEKWKNTPAEGIPIKSDLKSAR